MTTFSSFETANLRLSFIDEGEGPAVIALHGFPDSWRTWDEGARRLVAAGYRVIRLASRGYAPSGIPRDGRYDIAALTQDVIDLIDHLGLNRVAVLGHDWGASTAYALTQYAPERLAVLIALAVPPPATALGGWAERRARPHNLYLGLGAASDWWLRRASFAEVRRLYRLWSPRWTGNAAHVDRLITDLSPRERSRASVDYYRLGTERSATASDLPPMPSLLIYGADEPQVRRDGFERARDDRGTSRRVVRVEGVGHWPHLEAPELVLEEIIRFLEDHRAAWAR